MSVDPFELVVSSEEATLLARMAGALSFPAAVEPDLDAGGWEAVDRGLRARGLVHGWLRSQPVDEVEAILQVVLFADRDVTLNVVYRPGEGKNRAYGLWLRDDATVRHALTAEGVHTLMLCERAAVERMLAAATDLRPAPQPPAGDATTITVLELADALELNEQKGPAAVAERYPAAAGYAAALAGGDRSLTVHSSRRVGTDVYEEEQVMLVECPCGLWMAHDPPTTDPAENIEVLLQPVTVDVAREHMTRLIARGGA